MCSLIAAKLLHKTLLSKVIQILVSVFGWVSQTSAVGFCCLQDEIGESLKRGQNKVIRMLGFDIECGKDIGWKSARFSVTIKLEAE